MGVFDNISINLKIAVRNPIVYPGNKLEGTIQVECHNPMQVRALRLHLVGTERADYKGSMMDTDTRSGSFDASDVRQQNPLPQHVENRIMDITIGIAGLGTGAGEFIIPVGSFTYPFAIVLPKHLPGAFRYEEGETKCEIFYTATALLEIPWGRDISDEVTFQVLSCCPLSQWEKSKPSLMKQQADVTKCCCISKGHINVVSLLHRSILVMGKDNAYIKLDIENDSECEVYAVELQLLTKCTIRNNTLHTETSIGMKHTERVHIAQQQKQHVDLGFTIPFGIIPTVSGRFLSVESSLVLEFKVKGASNPVLSYPVYIVHDVDTTNSLPEITFGFGLSTSSNIRSNLPGIGQQASPEYYSYTPIAQGYMPFPSGIPVPQGPVYDMAEYQGIPTPGAQWGQMRPHQYQSHFEYQPVPPPADLGSMVGASIGASIGQSIGSVLGSSSVHEQRYSNYPAQPGYPVLR